MPRYFFHTHDGEDIFDKTGTVLPDLATAKTEAVIFAGRLLSEDAEKFWTGEKWWLEVTDPSGLVLFTLQFSAGGPEARQVRRTA